jgi:hypothetical protein
LRCRELSELRAQRLGEDVEVQVSTLVDRLVGDS